MNRDACVALRHDLETFAARASAEQAAQAHRIIEFINTSPAPWQRTTFAGHLTASAWITDPARQRVLLLHHKKLGQWLQPGGHIDDDDASVAHAALREAQEETGLRDLQFAGLNNSAIYDVDVHRIPARADEPAHFHYDIRFWFVTPDEGLTLNRDESHAIQWFKRSEIENDTFIDPSVRRMAAMGRDASFTTQCARSQPGARSR